MSLEQALIENTATMKQLIVVLSTAAEAGAVSAPTPVAAAAATVTGAAAAEPAKRTRRTKEQIAADEAAAAAAQGVAPAAGYLLPGDPEGTRYFDIASQNTVYKQLPGMPDCTVAGALITSGTDYEAKRIAYAALLPTGAAGAQATAAAATPATTTPAAQPASPTPSPASSGVTMQTITAKLMALHKAQGNAGLMPILQAFGAKSVPELSSKDLVAVDAAVEAALNPAPNLFG